jgi:hypothetical protein
MSAQAETSIGEADESGCWGRAASEEQLVRLGKHPAADSIRGAVTARQWHRLSVIGPVLRWVGRRSPW